MASAVSSQRLGSELWVQSYDHDPGGTSATITSPDGGTTIRTIDMRDYTDFMVVAKPNIVGGGGLTQLEIVAATDAAMTTPVVVKDSSTIAADALDDNAVLETTAEEIAALGSSLRYCAARLTCATATDEVTVTYIGKPVRPQRDLTVTEIA